MCAFNDLWANWIAIVIGVIGLSYGVRLIWDQPAPVDAQENMKRAIAFMIAAGAGWFVFFTEAGENARATQNAAFRAATVNIGSNCPPPGGFPYVTTFFAATLSVVFLFYLVRSLRHQQA